MTSAIKDARRVSEAAVLQIALHVVVVAASLSAPLDTMSLGLTLVNAKV